MRFELVLFDGSDRRFPLPAEGELLVGSAAECAVRLTAADVSRRHALLTVRRGVVSVLDLGSKNGTFLGGQKVNEAPMKAGDMVRFSSVLAQLVPLGTTSDSSWGAQEVAPVRKAARQQSPTSEIPVMDERTSLAWLLARWARRDAAAMPATLEWVVRWIGVRGAAVLRCLGGECAVLAAVGEVGPVLSSAVVTSLLGRISATSAFLETVPIEGDAGPVLAINCGVHLWLLLRVGEANPAADQVALFAQAVAVAHRLDG